AATSRARRPFFNVSDDGQLLLPCGVDTVRDSFPLHVYDAATGAQVGKAITAPGPISDAAFVPSTSLVVTGGAVKATGGAYDIRKQNLDEPGVVQFVNFRTGERQFADVPTVSQPIAVQCNPDGKTVVVLCHRGQLLILDAATGNKRGEHIAFE